MNDAERAEKAIEVGLAMVAAYEEVCQLFEESVEEMRKLAEKLGVDTRGWDTTEGAITNMANAHAMRAVLISLDES